MSKVVGIFDSYLDLSPQDERELQVFFDSLERDQKTVAVQSVVSSGSSRVVAGNVEIDWTKGVTLYNPTSGQRTIYLDQDGDAWFGKNTEVAAETALSIFANAQDYNGEEFGAGDVLLGDNSTSKANLLWDQSTGQLKLRSGTTDGIILDTDGSMQSGNYSSEASGWRIGADGDAEFNSIVARGTLRASVFQYESLSAVGGHFLVSKSAAEVATDVTTDTTFTLELKNDDEGGVLVASGDILEIKSWNGSEIIDVFVTAGTVTDNGDTASFTATLQSGGTGKLLQRGMGVANLGPSGSGMIRLQAGDVGDASVPTRMSIQTHTGSPWSALTDQLVLGDLYNTYGAGANHRYGFGVGDYSGGNYLTYNNDGAGTFTIKAGGGEVTIDENGIEVVSTLAAYQANKLKWNDGANDVLWMDSFINPSSSNLTAELIADNPYSSFGGITFDIGARAYTAFPADIDITPESGTSSSTFSIRQQGSTGTASWNGDQFVIGSALQITGQATPVQTGGALELAYYSGSNYGRLLAYDRSGTYKTLRLEGAAIQFYESGSSVLTIDGGDVYTTALTYTASPSFGGFSSFSTRWMYYKRIGKRCFVTARVVGTSNSTAKNLTLPFTAASGPTHYGMMQAKDNGSWGNGSAWSIASGASVINLYWYIPTGNWTASGTCEIQISFDYETA